MNQEKFKKQFKALIEYCSKNIDKSVCLEIKSESASLTGISKKMLAPQSAIVLIQLNEQTYVKGCLDGVYFESSSIDGLNASNSILLGIDCRSKDNNIIYYKSGRTIGRVFSSSPLNLNEAVYIFWEYEANACLTVCSFDPVRDVVVREVVSARDEPMKRFLRAVIRQALPSIEAEIEDNETPFYLEDDSEEEELEHESTSEWE
ncbi:hypothetical protein FHS16_002508 [Paenibacillus endophyticus]|uniref:Uncharacterized protein n=1 Tax=Paenibacillus endophyticus TaxID=1294268 RepID=A0A7W5C7B3_9BACL|nr:hypothetical protein [Paenibacillus endophyticus]MBB3152458.1 hypothetical protein [Paenibacillus endophyticus]